jgi:hypothetical protein
VGFERIPDTDIVYGLISYGAEGVELREEAGLMSQRLLDQARNEAVTNVFFFCHGWQGDQVAARAQYQSWIKAFTTSKDRQTAEQVFRNFKPLYIGLHWPSLPFGDEELRGDSYAAQAAQTPEALLNSYLKILGDSPEIRGPLEIIINEARRNAAPDELPQHIQQAYLSLNESLGLGGGSVDGPPDADRDEFDPEEAYEAASDDSSQFGGAVNLGGLLGPLRQLSYWSMKKRARTVGEGGMHLFLKNLQNATSGSKTRIHLMGHSFGTIVISGMLGGPDASATLPRPVDSVALVQGAVSLWSYAASIPFRELLRPTKPGYFSPVLARRNVSGPLVTTRSRYDDAVGVLYPWASRIKGSPSFAGSLPKYGAIGTYGLQGLAGGVATELDMLDANGPYQFAPGKVYNLDGSKYICHKDGISGAHSDIAGPEVAHAIWSAAFASV